MADFEDKVKAAFDAEFERNRPRPGLRGRVIANAVVTPRTRQGVPGTWLTTPRLAAVGAAAAILVVAGVGLRVATQGPPTAIKPTPTAAQLAFGKLPPPALHPPNGLGAGGGAPVTSQPYFGPATMTWSGQLPKVPSPAPVYRFTLPTPAEEDAFATRLGATFQSASAGQQRIYRGPDGYELSIVPDPVAQEPTFRLSRQSSPSPKQPFTDAAARAAADAELARLSLTPAWKVAVQVSTLNVSSDQPLIFVVHYQRLVLLPDGSIAGEVDGIGDPSGVQVSVDSGGQILEISGTVRLAEQSAAYPLRPPSALADAAVSATPAPQESGPVPAVNLTLATLVYTTVESDGIGYMEPAYLFTGTFSRGQDTLEKRVLIPAVAPSALR
jgi:hypothetical protein